MIESKMTFKMVSPTKVNILKDGKVVGDMWSVSPFSLDVQICGFVKMNGTWGCGRFSNTQDLTLAFRDSKIVAKENELKEKIEALNNKKKEIELSIHKLREAEVKTRG